MTPSRIVPAHFAHLTLAFQKKGLWNYTVHNNDHGVGRLMNTIMTIVDATTEPAAVADDKADPSVRLSS